MTDTGPQLDLERVRELFDLSSNTRDYNGGTYRDDPYPVWHRLRERPRSTRARCTTCPG